jgi:rRNA-processing protein FCF1
MKVLFDTSFLVSAMEFKIDLVSELMKFGKPEMFVLDLVRRELVVLSEGRGRTGRDARLSLMFIEAAGVGEIKTGFTGHTDRKMMTYALNRQMAVCTIDLRFKKSLVKRGVRVITIRQRKFLALVPPAQRTFYR